jgi:hypothetical protein
MAGAVAMVEMEAMDKVDATEVRGKTPMNIVVERMAGLAVLVDTEVMLLLVRLVVTVVMLLSA